ncbi:MAG: hypothetical protein JST39_16175, partial [Bacteroidetes bacterium]|nr:hypothetical protein [Bacteroidota bacterium]
DGNYVLSGAQAQTGTTGLGLNTSNYDATVTKIDPSGNAIWEKKYGGSGFEEAFSIKQTSDGGYIFAGTAASNDGDVHGGHISFWDGRSYSLDSWIVKLDAGGTLVWQKSMGGQFDEQAYEVAEVPGGYYTISTAQSHDADVSATHGQQDVWIVKLDGSGQITSEKTYGGSNTEYAQSMVMIGNDELAFIALTVSSDGDVSGNHGYADMWLAKLSSQPFRYNTIAGYAYIDANGNGVQDNGESVYDNQQLIIKDNNGTRSAYRDDATGHFTVKVDSGHYEVSLPYPNTGYRPIPKVAKAYFPGYSGSSVTGFGAVPESLVSGVVQQLDSLSIIRPSATAFVNVYYRFDGTRTNIDGIYTLIKDSRLILDSSYVQPFSVSGDTLVYKVNSGSNNDGANFFIRFKVADPPIAKGGDVVSIRYHLQPLIIDSAYFDKWDTLRLNVFPPINEFTGLIFLDLNGDGIF